MTPIVVTPPSTEPITLAEAKAHLRVWVDDDDDQIAHMIKVAREAVEMRTGRALMPQRVRIGMGAFSDVVRLPRPPYDDPNVPVVEYIDEEGDQQSLASTVYHLNKYVEPAEVTLAYGQSWPTIRPVPGGVTFEYTAGYVNAASVPTPLKQWMLLCIGTMYEHREMNSAGVQIYSIPEDFMSLLWQPYMVYL
jgi:uncharacterized phiE125 gp8 family phage protein